MNFSSEYEIDAEHEVDRTPTNDEESGSANKQRMNCSMQKGNKGKLRTGTANKATTGLGGPQRSRNDELRP